MNCDACGRLIQEHPTVRYEGGQMNVFHSDPTCLRSKPRPAPKQAPKKRSSEATLDFGAILGGGEKSEQEDG